MRRAVNHLTFSCLQNKVPRWDPFAAVAQIRHALGLGRHRDVVGGPRRAEGRRRVPLHRQQRNGPGVVHGSRHRQEPLLAVAVFRPEHQSNVRPRVLISFVKYTGAVSERQPCPSSSMKCVAVAVNAIITTCVKLV